MCAKKLEATAHMRYSAIKLKLAEVERRINLMQEMEVNLVPPGGTPKFVYSDRRYALDVIDIDPILDRISDLEDQAEEESDECNCEDEINDLQTQINGLQSQIDDLEEQLNALFPGEQEDFTPVEVSPDSIGNRVVNARHIYDINNADTIVTDVWKYEAWIVWNSGTGITFNLRKSGIFRSIPGRPAQSGIQIVRPDGATGNNADYLSLFASASSGLLDVGDVWTFQYKFEDAGNFIGDTNEPETDWIDFMTATVIQTPSSGATGPFVLFDVLIPTATYNNVSGSKKP